MLNSNRRIPELKASGFSLGTNPTTVMNSMSFRKVHRMIFLWSNFFLQKVPCLKLSFSSIKNVLLVYLNICFLQMYEDLFSNNSKNILRN